MERKLSKIKKSLSFSLILFFSVVSMGTDLLFAQTPSIIEHIRFPVWADVDAYPGTQAASEDMEAEEYDYPIARIKEITPFLIGGLVYGWDFVYCPSDKTRGVEEFFQVTPVYQGKFDIKYSSVWIENNRFNCWIDYTRNANEIQTYNLWASIKNPTIQGRGFGDLSLGFEGIKQAAEEALKDAVREYYRNTTKNKPKEIRGSVLMRKTPLIGIDSGRYVIKLDFFLECGTIIEYTQF